MKYDLIVPALFIERPNRFIAHCKVGDEIVKVHVKNTGRCKELLISGCSVYLQFHDNPKRKTQYSLIGVEKGARMINMDSQVPNKVVYEAISNQTLVLPELEEGITLLKPEQVYRHSRFDAYLETVNHKAYVEVKGVTLEEDGIVRFPDAPTERGVKHIEELIEAVKEGYKAYLIFIIQMKAVKYFEPNTVTHEAFAKALQSAQGAGVILLAYDCHVTEDEIILADQVPIHL